MTAPLETGTLAPAATVAPRGLRRLLVEKPWLLAIGVYLLALMVVQPWGNYALNDDWTYAHVAKRFGETGVLKIDTPVVANTVGQSVMAMPVIRLFGFSFLGLRLYTIALAILALWMFDRVLRVVAPQPVIRIAALLVLALNPIYFYSSATFMTEIYGWLPGLSAAALWFWDRQRRPDELRPVTWWVAAVCGFLGAFPFWIRQPCVVIFAAILGGTLARYLLTKNWKALKASIPVFGLSSIVFGVTVGSFFLWANLSGNLPSEFQKRIPNLFKIDGTTWIMQSGAAVVYQTAYFLPFLVLLVPKVRARLGPVITGVVCFALALWARSLFERIGGNDYGHGMMWAHKSFPYLMNIMYAGGLGPITVSDVFWSSQPGPTWPAHLTRTLEVVLLASTLLWGPLLVSSVKAVKQTLGTIASEVLLFGLLLPVVGMASIIQGHQMELLDRYHMPLILGFAMLVPATLAVTFRKKVEPVHHPITRGRAVAFLILFAPIAFFSVGGLHDLFRWNDARWELINEGYRQGATLATLEAGFESSCWYREEGMTTDRNGCDNTCQCMYFAACCVDDRWRVGMAVMPGYTPLKSIHPDWWLVNGPSLHLSKR